jgi:hypothetical protein
MFGIKYPFLKGEGTALQEGGLYFISRQNGANLAHTFS